MAAIVLDFTNVKESSGINPKHQPSGDYHGRITKVEQKVSKKDSEPMLVIHIQDMDMLSAVYPQYCKLDEDNLWKVRQILVAVGMTVPKKRIKLDTDKLVGKDLGMTLEDDEYNGKMKSVIAAVFPAADLTQDDDDDDEPPAKAVTKKSTAATKKAKPAPVDEDEDEDEESEDLDELDIDEL